MRAGVALTVVAAVLVVPGCGASHRVVVSATVGFPPEPPHVALISARSGVLERFLSLPVSSAVSDGQGGWFVGGGVGLARIRADGRFDRSWNARPSVNFVSCLLIRRATLLYVEGPDRVEAFDAKTGAHRWTSAAIEPKGSGICGGGVRALAASATAVYV